MQVLTSKKPVALALTGALILTFKEQISVQDEWSLRYLEEHARWRNKWKDIYLKSE